ncbi:putative phage abortive infection protein [Vibrio splendidus]
MKFIVNKVNHLIAGIDKQYPRFESLFVSNTEVDNKTDFIKALFDVLKFAIIVAACLLVVNISIVFWTDKGGVFGDFLGGVLNPILTFLTLFGLIITIVIQRQELKLARGEYEKTAEALSTQAIETTFFNVLDLHHQIVDNIKVDLNELKEKGTATVFTEEVLRKLSNVKINSVFEGRGAFEEILNFLSHKTSNPQEVVERYRSLQDKNNHVLGHYFRNLYQALKVIDGYDEEELSRVEKRKYTSILRAQLSTKELALLFINCLEGICDSGQFKNLIIRYQMLEHLPITQVNGGYALAGSRYPIASDEMFLEYKTIIEIPVSLTKTYGGAFGNNLGVPHNLRPNKSIKSDA